MEQEQIVDVRTIYSNASAFAAVQKYGTVVTFGNDFEGGSSYEVQELLVDVESIIAYFPGSGKWPTSQQFSKAFAALKKDGSVISWGSSLSANFFPVQDELKNVKAVVASGLAFAAMVRE